MKELNYRFKSIEEKIIDGKEVHRANDIFDNKEVFIERFQDVNDMSWEETSKVEEELNKLKDNKIILDFFYNNDYEKNLKIFYKVFEEYDEYNKTCNTNQKNEINNNEMDKNESRIKNEVKNESDIENIIKKNKKIIEMEIKKQEVLNKEIRAKTVIEAEKIKENYENSQKEIKIVHKLDELGGSVKVNIPNYDNTTLIENQKDEEDIFEDNLIKNEENKTSNLELNYKKSRSRTHLNDKIICKFCQSPIKTEKLDLENNIAYCETCHSIRQIEKLGKEEEVKIDLNLIAPEGIKVINRSNKLHIETNLNTLLGYGQILGSIALFIFGIFSAIDNNNNFIYLTGIFSLGILYIGLIKILNKIYIDVTKQKIIIQSKPLFHFPQKTIASRTISQIYVKEYIHKTKNNKTYSYKVRAILKNGKDIVLVKLDNSQYALYLERSIESWLEIKDRHINGEYK